METKNNESLITVADQTKQLQKILNERTAQIAAALPPGTLTPDRFARVVITLCARNTDLMTKCNPSSLIRAVMESAQLGLAPDPVLGEAWFVPFKGTVQMIPGYKGLVKLAWQSDRLAKISARAVYQGDVFEFEYGLEEKLVHQPRRISQSITNVYSVAKIKGGETMFNVMTIDEVNAVRARSPAGRSNFSPWQTDFEAMALKTTLRRLCKLLPLSTTDSRLAVALDHDMRAESGLKQQFTVPSFGDEQSEDVDLKREAELDSMPIPHTKGEQ